MLGLFTDRLLININHIDEQHKKMFEIIEQFHNACQDRKQYNKVVDLYKIFKRYVETHFREEEEYMLKYNYPEYKNHKEEHNIFLRKVYSLNNTVNNKYICFAKMMDINEFFTEGLLTHFSDTDSRLGEFLKDKLEN